MPVPAFIRPIGLEAGAPVVGAWASAAVPVITPTGIACQAPEIGVWAASSVAISPVGLTTGAALIASTTFAASGVPTPIDDGTVIIVDAPLRDVVEIWAPFGEAAAA